MTYKVKIFTLFPDAFPGTLGLSIPGRALKDNKWQLEVINIRDYTSDRHQTCDDTPYGGGNGMIMLPEILGKAIEANNKDLDTLIYMSPRGQKFNQVIAKQYSQLKNIGIICGRFEGIDQRILDYYQIEEVSIGDYVLFGGEIAAQAIIEAALRLVPYILDEADAIKEESFGEGEFANLLEYPQYTKPRTWNGLEVPEILLSGNHQEIKKWRLQKAQEITKKRN